MAKDENIFIHDATPTWSGFIYQGEVAIYLAVCKICDLIENGLSKEVIKSEYWLEVEKSEDIAVVKDDGKQKQYLSIHQVKNQKDNSICDYRNPLIQLMLEKGFWKMKSLGNPEAFLHISSRVKEDNNTIDQQLSSWAKCINDFYNSIKVFIGNYIEENERENFYNKIGGIMKNEPIKLNRTYYKKLIDGVVKSCNDKKYDLVKDKLKELLEYLENKLAIDYIDEKVMLFPYDSKKLYCEGKELFNKIVEQVRRYKNNDKYISKGQYEYIADRLLHYMRNHVLQRHNAIQKGGIIKAEISFGDLFDILDLSISIYEREANILALRRGYEEILSQYCRTVCKHQCEKTNNYECKIYKDEYEKVNLSDEEFVRMCFHYNPDCDKSIDDRDCLMKLLRTQGMQESAFEILKNVSNIDFINANDKTKVIVNNQNNNAFLTAIEGKNSEIAVENITRGINNNAELVSPIFEADELITVDLSSEGSVWDYDYVEIEEKFISNKTKMDSDVNHHSICNPKKPRFVTAKEIIGQFS
ncbi:MAG: hypothetical protein K2O91_21000 [Lachnospiraceae bacterium]|nr:hypothetical protein [Lachnospiraceae bacterium]